MSVIELLTGILLFIILAIIAYMVYKSVRSGSSTSVLDNLKSTLIGNRIPPSTLPITATPPPSTLPINVTPPPSPPPSENGDDPKTRPVDDLPSEIMSGDYKTDPITNLSTEESGDGENDNFTMKQAKFYELHEIAVPEGNEDEDEEIDEEDQSAEHRNSISLNDDDHKMFGLGKFLRKRAGKPKNKTKNIK